MRICIDMTHLIPGHTGGSEVYLMQVLKHLIELRPDFQFLVLTSREAENFAECYSLKVEEVKTGVEALKKPKRLIWQQLNLRKLIASLNVELAWFPSYFAPARVGCASVVVIHDTGCMRFPQDFPLLALPVWRYFVPRSARSCDAVITGSEFGKSEIVRFYKPAPERVHVIPYGLGEKVLTNGSPEADRKVLEQYGITRPFLFTAAYTHPHKNLTRWVRAFLRLQSTTNMQLVLTGGKGTAEEEVQALVSGNEKHIRKLGFVPTEHLGVLYRNARVFVFPTMYEGFGFPVLEAMLNRLPVACSSLPVLKEVAGEAAEYFDPENEGDMLRAVKGVLENTNRNEALIRLGEEQVRKFSWANCARAHAILFERLVAEKRTQKNRC